MSLNGVDRVSSLCAGLDLPRADPSAGKPGTGVRRLRCTSDVNPIWRLPPPGRQPLSLSGNQVHVWRAWLDVSESSLDALRATLSADELGRAERFAFARDRHRFVAARGTLRAILGRYLEADPGLLRFDYGEWGKPFLSPVGTGIGSGDGALCFNLSHSDGLALYAVAACRQIGIDVERVCVVQEMEQIARRFFSAAERRALCALSGQARRKAFLNLWTRKEAYAKAKGQGLAAFSDRSSSPPDREPPALQQARWCVGVDAWTLHQLCPDPEYVAALVVQDSDGLPVAIECWQFPGLFPSGRESNHE